MKPSGCSSRCGIVVFMAVGRMICHFEAAFDSSAIQLAKRLSIAAVPPGNLDGNDLSSCSQCKHLLSV